MHIRRLARNAALITVAATVMGGFLTGMAGATNATPASTVPAAASGGTIPRMLPVVLLNPNSAPMPVQYVGSSSSKSLAAQPV